MDLIDRQAAIDALTTAVPITLYDVIRVFEALPTIDAVPVIRCKDCKHWGTHKSLNVPWCFEMHIDKSEDGFCDSGERREE